MTVKIEQATARPTRKMMAVIVTAGVVAMVNAAIQLFYPETDTRQLWEFIGLVAQIVFPPAAGYLRHADMDEYILAEVGKK